MSGHHDGDARARIAADLDTTLLVEAAAGTGKTTCLVRRLLALIAAGADVLGLVAVTFTDKAAGEMKLRLRSGLEEARRAGESDARQRAAFERAARDLEQAHVSTIHRFAADLLRMHPVEAGIDPRFSLITPVESKGLVEEAFFRWLERALAAPSLTLRRVLARDKASAETLLWAARDRVEHRHLPAPWTRRPCAVREEAEGVLAQAERLWARASAPTSRADELFLAIRPVGELLREAQRRRFSDEELEAELCALARKRAFERLPKSGFYNSTTPRADILAELSTFRAGLATFAARASADLAALLQGELAPVVAEYEAQKRRRGALDFADLLLAARDLVARRSDVRDALRARFSHVLIDEFQDTDLAQADLLVRLASRGEGELDDAAIVPGKLFVVGDPKQSIYRFRNADPAIYERVKRAVTASGGAVLHLSRSFRSTPGVIELVNAAFAGPLDGDPEALQAAYVPLTATRPASGPTCPPVVALPIPAPYGKKNLSKAEVRASLPGAIAGFVSWLVESSGWQVVDPESGRPAPIAPHHVAVLFRQFESFGRSRVEPLSLALTAANVPHVVLGDRHGGARTEAHAVIAALTAIEHTDEPFWVYAALHGLLFGFSDALLFEWIQRYGALAPGRPPITALPEHLGELGAALGLLHELHRRRNRRAPIETLHALLGAVRAHVGFGLSPSAEQAFLQLASIEQTAAVHEKSGGLSYRTFVELFAEGTLEKSVAVDDEADAGGGLRIITVHRAKGLEYPVVILADPATDNAREPDRFVDPARGLGATRLAGLVPWDLSDNLALEQRRAQAEGVRTAYVAATRARDLLVVPFVGDDPAFPTEGWLTPLCAAVRPEAPSSPIDPAGMSGADVTLVRPLRAEPRQTTVSGLHRAAGGLPVLVFDPLLGGVARGDARGVRETELITKDADPALVAIDRAAFEAFFARRAEVLSAAGVPRHTVETSTARAHRGAAGAGAEVGLLRVPRAATRPRGKQFGTFVHNVLALVDLGADATAVAGLARSLGRLLGTSEAEVEAAAGAVTATLAHPLFAEVRAAAAVHRETPLTLRDDDGAIVEGVVDLAYEPEDGAIVVVDFKTDDPDAISPDALGRYRAQVELYVRALSRALAKPARGLLLFV